MACPQEKDIVYCVSSKFDLCSVIFLYAMSFYIGSWYKGRDFAEQYEQPGLVQVSVCYGPFLFGTL